ncbi:hypothetical protein PPACK8108_LOCUS7546 [Phakopsora pachyrhizi]|uniref:Uncharacterized protein n=1 Tax=Phakopsora pachyrhizi TaxID=170000 RepID=A0AAV0AT46_PHAPC|nr:hypothetical protein PPACK8108_LOCUS7546 [Phakopsora pachyrhizi]
MLNSVYCTWLILSYLCNFFFDVIIVDEVIYFVECCIISIMLNSVYCTWLILSYLCNTNFIHVIPYIALHAKDLVG